MAKREITREDLYNYIAHLENVLDNLGARDGEIYILDDEFEEFLAGRV